MFSSAANLSAPRTQREKGESSEHLPFFLCPLQYSKCVSCISVSGYDHPLTLPSPHIQQNQSFSSLFYQQNKRNNGSFSFQLLLIESKLLCFWKLSLFLGVVLLILLPALHHGIPGFALGLRKGSRCPRAESHHQ